LTPAYTYGRGDTSRIPGTSAPWATVGIALEPGWPPKNDLRYGATHICGKLDTISDLGGAFWQSSPVAFFGPWEDENDDISLGVEQKEALGSGAREQKC